MISVIMPSLLWQYPYGATNREEKLYRAINSFLIQGLGELIVIADGCEPTIEIVKEYSRYYSNISGYLVPKQVPFSGALRNCGIENARYSWICYLDSDDSIRPGHLINIASNITNDIDWMYFTNILGKETREVEVKAGFIGTSNIAHKKDINAKWPDGYGHDWGFIQQFPMETNKHKKIPGGGYVVHHTIGTDPNKPGLDT